MDLLPEFAAGLRVHAGGGLVEQQQLGLVNHARGQGEPLFPAAGKLAGKLVAPLGQAEPLEALAHRLAAILDEVHPRDEIEVLGDAQVLPEAEPLGHVADLPLDGLALGDHVVAQARAAALVGAEQAAEHADERGLAAAVGAEEAADLARADRQIDVIDGRQVAEPLGHSLHIDGKIVSHRSCHAWLENKHVVICAIGKPAFSVWQPPLCNLLSTDQMLHSVQHDKPCRVHLMQRRFSRQCR